LRFPLLFLLQLSDSPTARQQVVDGVEDSWGFWVRALQEHSPIFWIEVQHREDELTGGAIDAESFEQLRRLVARLVRSVEEYASDPRQDGDSPGVLAALGHGFVFDLIERRPNFANIDYIDSASHLLVLSVSANFFSTEQTKGLVPSRAFVGPSADRYRSSLSAGR
jgi:hypothetical protein